MLTINEIFHSIQGESTRAGQPCVFVRLTACDLRCSWCDTPYAFHEGRKMSVDEVVAAVEAYDCPLVEITGGEPLLQDDVYPLMERLLAQRPDGDARDRRPPADRARAGGGREDRRRQVSRQRRSRRRTTGAISIALAPHDEVKFVVQDRADYEFARDVIARHDLAVARRRGADVAGARRARSEDARRSGCSPIGCRRACSCSSTSSSGRRPARDGVVTSCRRRAVVLLSGGLDSYTAAAIAKAQRLRAVRADDSLRPAPRARDRGGARGRARARRRAASRADGRSARDRRLVAHLGRRRAARSRSRGAASIPSTYVPARNTIFLSLALGWAEVLGARDIVIGVNALDYSGYPDCRPEFIAAFEGPCAFG